MNSEVNVTIEGIQVGFDEEDKATTPVPIRTVQNGRYYQKNNKEYIIYEELFDKDNPKSIINNTIIIEKDSFQIIRNGFVRSRLLFKAGERYATSLITPMGTMYMMACTSICKVIKEDERILLRSSYELSINDKKISTNAVEISITNL